MCQTRCLEQLCKCYIVTDESQDCGQFRSITFCWREKLPMDFRFCNFADILLAFGGKYINSTIEFILLQYFNVIWAS